MYYDRKKLQLKVGVKYGTYLIFQLGVSTRSSSAWTVQRPVSNYSHVEIQQIYIQ